MLYGMGTVFIFLTILVFATRAMSFFVARFAPDQAENTQTQSPNSVPTGNAISHSPDVLEAIKQAIAMHRAR